MAESKSVNATGTVSCEQYGFIRRGGTAGEFDIILKVAYFVPPFKIPHN